MIKLSLTFDYELFGNGTGDVFEHIVIPTKKILEICNVYNIKTTIFFEVIEYLKLKEQWMIGNNMGYTEDPIKAIEVQLQQAALEGHDIQLHIHPQWVNAKWSENAWVLDMANWRLGDFKSSEYTIDSLLRKCKDSLEQLIRKVIPNYKCTLIRAGAFNIMPSDKVYLAMCKIGLKADSSVYPGGFENTTLSRYDYREVTNNIDYWWGDSNDMRVASKHNKQIMEIPIFALPQRRLYKLLNRDKLFSLFSKNNSAISSVAKEKIAQKSLYNKLTFLFGKEALTWDFCLFSKHLHKTYFSHIENNLIGKRNAFVIIGHPKSYKSDRSLRSLIQLAKKSKVNYSFKTLKEIHEEFCC